jgi:hypothetical protein
LTVVVDSAFTRSAPSTDAAPSASLLEGNTLIAIGRNADGTWFEARRPGRTQALGWVARTVVTFTFNVAALPLTDAVTGVSGPVPVVDTGVSAFILQDARLRNAPDGEQIGSIPNSVVVPVIEREQDNLWIEVNYNGNTGWVARFLTTVTGDLSTVPLQPVKLPPFPILIIPPEVQLAQVKRLRAYIQPRYELAISLGNYWEVLYRGTILPCDPPDFLSSYFAYTHQDSVELPELRRYVPTLQSAVDNLNGSVKTLQRCGVYSAEDISKARGQAFSAAGGFADILGALDDLEKNVIQ